MFEGFADKSAKIIVVEGQQPIRNMIVEVLREIGFRPQSTPTLDDAITMLSGAHYDWIIAGHDTGKNWHPRDLLLLAIRHPELRNLSVSLMIDEPVLESMPDLFALGLLSYHMRPFTKASFGSEISALLESLYAWNYRAPLVAGSHIRSFLTPRNKADEIVEFDETLSALFPVDPQLQKNLSVSLRLAGRYREAIGALTRAAMLHESYGEEAKQIKETIAKEAAAKNYDLSTPINSQDILGFSSIVIVDNDDAIVANAKAVLAEGGAKDILTFADGETYWSWQKENPLPALIIMEWRVPKVTGAKLIQRILGIKGQIPPAIAIQSSQVLAQDLGLLKELGVTTILRKPWRKSEFIGGLLGAAACKNRPTSYKQLETRIRALLRARKIQEASKMIHTLIKDPQGNPGSTMLLRAELELANQNFSGARDLCMSAMKTEHDAVHALHTLGKALLGLNQYEMAVKCFERAQKLSPVNVERLCLLATAESEAGHGTAATEHVKSALQLDSGNETVQETDAQVAIANGDTKRATSILETLPSLLNVVAYQNNRAVALAKSTRVDEALQTYLKTIKVLPEKAKDTRATVQYNLALSYVKSGQLPQAADSLKAILESPKSRVYSKAIALQKKLSQAIEQKTTLYLNQNEGTVSALDLAASSSKNKPGDGNGNATKNAETKTPTNPEDASMLNLIDFQPGARACFQIFRPHDTAADKLQAMFRSLPRFVIRANRDKAAS